MDSSRLRYGFGDFELDTSDKVLLRLGQSVPLTPKAFDTLAVLVERHGRLVTKDELMHLVWPDAFVEENNLAQNISALRRALGESVNGDKFIETVPRRGYRFVARVTTRLPGTDRSAEDAMPAAPAIDAALLVRLPLTAEDVGPPSERRRRLRPVLVAAAAIVVVAGTVLVFRQQVAPAGAARVPGFGPEVAGAATPAATRIAVLPMVNLGPPADASFVSGLTEELTSRLAGLRHVAVPSSTTIGAYDRRGKPATRIGADLRVDYIVEGSVRWSRDGASPRVRMTPRLVRVADDTTVWTQQYDASVSDLFGVQEDIARRITEALRVALDSAERFSDAARPSADPDAYMAYLRGMALVQLGAFDTANIAAARAELEQAVARDPGLAPAWSWLARVYAVQYRTGAARTPEIIERAMKAARTAIALDPSRPDLRLGLVEALSITADDEGFQRELDRARASLPNSLHLLLRQAWTAQVRGRWGEAEFDFLQGFDRDPAFMAEPLAVHHLFLRHYDEARRYISVARAANQTGVTVPEAWTHFSDAGDIDAARQVLETAHRMRSPADARVLGLLARFEWYDGKPSRALEVIAEMAPAGSWLAPNFRFPASLAAAHVYESQGRRDDATRRYREAYDSATNDHSRHTPEHRREIVCALAAAGLGRTDEALARARRAVELLPVTRDATEGPLHLFLSAQVHARVGDHATAFALLDQLFSVPGFYSHHWVLRDPGFGALRRRPEFAAAIARWSRPLDVARYRDPRVLQGSQRSVPPSD